MTAEKRGESAEARDEHGRFAAGNPFRFGPGNRAGLDHGRPPGPDLIASLRKALAADAGGHSLATELYASLGQDPNGKTVADALIAAGIVAALNGNGQMWREIVERIEGKVAHRLEGSVTVQAQARAMLDEFRGDEPFTLEAVAKAEEHSDE